MFRPAATLRKKYENIKKRTKQKFADEKCYVKGTGGGPPKNIHFDEIDLEVKEILGTRIDGLPSEFDGDAVEIAEIVEDDILLEIPVPNATEGLSFLQESTLNIQDHSYAQQKNEPSKENFENSSCSIMSESINKKREYNCNNSPTDVEDWSTYTPAKLKSKKSKVLTTHEKPARRTEISSKVSQWAQAKTELEHYKRTCMDKENDLKLQFIEEKHRKELKLMEEESAAKISLLKTEQKFKLKLLLTTKYPNLSKEQLEILFNKIYNE